MGAVRNILVLLVVLLAAGCGDTISDAEHVERAQDHLDKGELLAASIELKNALQENQGNAQARRLLGLVHLKAGNAEGAEKELRRASELGVAPESVLPLLARALLTQGKLEDLEALPVTNLRGGVEKAQVLSAQGLGMIRLKKIDKAQELIQSAAAIAPESPYVGLSKAWLSHAKQMDDDARKELDSVFKLDAKYAPAWSLLGSIEQFDKNFAAAERAFTKAIENRMANTADRLSRALVRIDLGKYDSAQEDVDRLLESAPKDPAVNYAQGLIHFHKNALQAAIDSFELSLRANNRQLLPKFYLGLANLRLGSIEQADNYAEQVFAARPNSIAVRKLLAVVKLKKGQPLDAEKLVRPIVAVRDDDVTAKNILATALVEQKKFDLAVPLLKEALALEPDSAIAEMRLGAALLGAGQSAAGIEQLQHSLKKDPGLHQAYVLLIRTYVAQKDLDAAMRVAESYRDNNPKSAIPWNLIGGLELEKGDEKGATQAFERARGLAPGDPTACTSLAALAVKNKQYDKARAYYQDILTQHKNHLDTLLRLALLDSLEKNEPAMLAHLKEAVSTHPKAVRPNVMLARYYLSKGEADKVNPLMVELTQEDKRNPTVLEVMAYSQLTLKQYSDAKYSLEQLIQRRPDSAMLHFLLAKAYGGLNQAEDTEQELLKAVSLEPNFLAARLALARLAMSRNQKDKMREQVAELEKLAPEHPDVLYLKALLIRAGGNQKAAIDLLQEVFEKAPSTKTMLSVAQQKWAIGDPEGALSVQEEWVKEHPEDLVASLALAGAYDKEDDRDKAISEYERVLQNDENNIVALNDLAWNLRDTQPAKALEYAQRASELAPNSSSVLDTLAMVQLSNKQLEIAQRTIERALAKAPENRSMQYHRAMIYSAAGKIRVARQGLKKLLASKEDFAERGDAQKLLRRLESEYTQKFE